MKSAAVFLGSYKELGVAVTVTGSRPVAAPHFCPTFLHAEAMSVPTHACSRALDDGPPFRIKVVQKAKASWKSLGAYSC